MTNISKQYPNMESYFETSDGEKFFTENAAVMHSKLLKEKGVTEIFREKQIASHEDAPALDVEPAKQESVKDITAKIPSMDMEALEAYLAAENVSEMPRASLVKALAKRIAELQAAAQNPEA